jgi:hypothetical protein
MRAVLQYLEQVRVHIVAQELHQHLVIKVLAVQVQVIGLQVE